MSEGEPSLWEDTPNAGPIDVEESSVSVEKWCSWCYAFSEHRFVRKRKILRFVHARSVHECVDCGRHTVRCIRCPGAMARSHGIEFDKLCACCDGTIYGWGVHLEPADVTAFCSWCFEKTDHRQVQQHFLKRNSYECLGCRRHTAKCRSCSEAVARAHGGGSASRDWRCCKCDGTIGDWDNPARNRENTRIVRWCSWCFDICEFDLERKRGLELKFVRRSEYSCRSCSGRVHPCVSCEEGAARGGVLWDDKRCARCASAIADWAAIASRKQLLFSLPRRRDVVIYEMTHASPQRDAALRAGLIRPFLLLCSMQPAVRNEIACSLGWPLITSASFGSAHGESWEILTKHRLGLLDRCMHSWQSVNPLQAKPSWYAILRQMMAICFAEVSVPSMKRSAAIAADNDPRSRCSADLEELFVQHVFAVQMGTLSRQERAALQESMAATTSTTASVSASASASASTIELDDRSDDTESLSVSSLSTRNAEVLRRMRKYGVNRRDVAWWSVALMKESVATAATPLTGAASGAATAAAVSVAVALVPGIGVITTPLLGVAAFLGPLAIPLAFASFLPVIVQGLQLYFRSSHQRCLPAVLLCCEQRLLLAAEGTALSDGIAGVIHSNESEGVESPMPEVVNVDAFLSG